MTGSAGAPRWRGGNLGPVLIAIPLVVAVVIGTRWPGAGGGRPEPSTPAPVATSAAVATAAPTSPAPSTASAPTGVESTPRTVVASVGRVGSIEELGGVQAASFKGRVGLGSVSPDGRFALVKVFAAEVVNPEPVELFAAPLGGGLAIALGTARYERREPNDAQVRLVEPVWSSDGLRVAFEAGLTGTIVSLADGTRTTFAAQPDRAIIVLSDGGFLAQGPAGPAVIGSAMQPLPAPAGLTPIVWLRDGQVLVGYTDTGDLVWTDGTASRTIASAEDPRTPIWSLVTQSAGGVIVIPELMKRGRAVVVDGSGTSVTLGDDRDGCESPVLSDDVAFAAYTVCDQSTYAVTGYGIRVVRLADGAAIDLYAGAVGPRFIPGTHRLAWLALSGPVEARTFTVSAATNEVLP